MERLANYNQAIPFFEVLYVRTPPSCVLPHPHHGAGRIPDAAAFRGGAPKQEAKRLALIVGVNEYQNRNLENLKYAERDATELQAVLKKAGFSVRLLLGSGKGPAKAAKTKVESALEDLLKGVGKRDLLLLAFSGHGQQMFVKETGQETRKEMPFFCPKDAVPNNPETLLSFNGLLRVLAERGPGTNLLLVDASRNVVDPSRGIVDGIPIDLLREGTAVFFSCSRRQQSYETNKAGGGHGVFFHFVLEGLQGAKGAVNDRGQVTWERLVPYVKEPRAGRLPPVVRGLAGFIAADAAFPGQSRG